jgi:shikimate kinase
VQLAAPRDGAAVARESRFGYVKPGEILLPRLLITGMSGTGKSSVIEELVRRGVHAIDTDTGEWSEWQRDLENGGYDWVWREDRFRALLTDPDNGSIVLSGCKTNQGTFYPLFDQVVLLTAPLDLLLYRVMHRTNNDYGKSSFDQFMIRQHVEMVEPLLRQSSDIIFDTSRMGIDEVADEIETLLSGGSTS